MTASESLTGKLISLVWNKPVTSPDLQATALFLLDAYANIAGGRVTDAGQCILGWADTACSVTASDAGRNALIGGALCHMLETDDLHRASVVHPGCVVIPAALAVAESAGETSGKRVLTAILWGYEAACRVGMAVGPAHYRIWHNTGTCGPFGAAMAGAYLLDLTPEQTCHALGNAGTQSAGLWQFLETGAMSKFLHAGRAAEAGVVAAQLAAAGFTGPPRILEGPQGLFAGACPDADPDAVLATPEASWQLHQTSIKPWPCCRHTHGPISAALEARRQIVERGRKVDEITGVTLGTYRAALDVCDRPAPANDYAAKFSLQHCIAAALIEDEVGLQSFDAAAREALRPIAAKVDLGVNAENEAVYPDRWGCDLHVAVGEETTIHVAKPDAKGDPEDPVSRQDMIAKAHALLSHGGHEAITQGIDTILAMAEGGSAVSLSSLLTSNKGGQH